MKKQHERVLIAALAGLVIVATAAFAVSPTMAAGYTVDAEAQVTGVARWDVLNLRKWPASYSKKIGELRPNATVWVVRCRTFTDSADWCLVESGRKRGWVNSRYLELAEPDDDYGYDDDI